MGFPVLIREESFSAANNVQFGGGGIGMPNNAPEAFDGTFERLFLTLTNIVFSEDAHLDFYVGAGGSIPFKPGNVYRRYARSFDASVPATTHEVNSLLNGDPEAQLTPIVVDVATGQSLDLMMFILLANVSTFGYIHGEGVYINTTGGSAISYFDFGANLDTATKWEGLHLEPRTGTFSGVSRLYGLSV